MESGNACWHSEKVPDSLWSSSITFPGCSFSLLDERGRYVFWNRNAETVLGYSANEMDGRPGIDLVAEEDRERVTEAISRVLLDGTGRVEYSKLTRDGRRIPILAEGVRFTHADRTFIIGIQVDISERRRMERALLSSREDLRSLTAMLATAEETERRRISTGLHNRAAQDLALAILQLRGLAASSSDAGQVEVLDRVCRLIQHTAEELRSLSLDLSPPELYDVGLAAALESLALRFEAAHSLPCSFQSEAHVPELPETQRAVVYRSAQELLANVSRHAKAGRVTVTLRRQDSHLLVDVEDDGRGFASNKAGRRPDLGGGFGLFSIHEQLRHLGGQLLMESSPGRGTRAILSIPVPNGERP
ncbi:MAG: PAS domain S-box protein [Acidobacteria bacterium]|nr:PAS domain S-box protein [Acidobacteriota bacterium]